MASSVRWAWTKTVVMGLAVMAVVSPLRARQPSTKISARDQIKVTVFGLEGMSGDFQVDADGTFKFPPLGLVKAAGMTPREVETTIADGLVSGGFAVHPPQVTIALQPVASKSVIVTGEVKTPGTFPYAGEITLYQALVKAGLPTAAAGDQILIVHDMTGPSSASTNPAAEDIETRSYRDLENGNRANDITLRDGDRVFVKKAGQVYIGGFVHNPGAYTVESGGVTLRQALTLAQGVTERGSEKRVEILRKVPGRDAQKIKDVSLDTIVKPGDTVTVKARIF